MLALGRLIKYSSIVLWRIAQHPQVFTTTVSVFYHSEAEINRILMLLLNLSGDSIILCTDSVYLHIICGFYDRMKAKCSYLVLVYLYRALQNVHYVWF